MNRFLPLISLLLASSPVLSSTEDGSSLAITFQRAVDRRLDVPKQDQARYAQLLETALVETKTPITKSQYVVMVDRNPFVQAIFVIGLTRNHQRIA